jgi:16S rRNA (guanine527-N7)-methyltransferase
LVKLILRQHGGHYTLRAMGVANLEQLRREAASRFGVTLSDETLARFDRYAELLGTWSRSINLTAVSSGPGILSKHFLDSLSPLPFISSAGRLIDVGSGAGFPGIPIAVVRPDIAVTLVEAKGKKAAFLRAVLQALSLRCEVMDERLEAILGRDFAPFDYAVSRATFEPAEWLAYGQKLVRPGGAVLVMTGRLGPPGGAEESLGYTLPDGERRHVALYRVPKVSRET